nr:ABC transporter permease [Piscinibacter sp.]
MAALLLALSWPELRLHPWRNATALLAVALGVALAFAVQLINASALAEFGAAVRSVNGEPDFELRSPWRGSGGGFDEMLYARVAAHPQVAIASPVVEVDTYALRDDGQRVALRVLGLDLLVAAPLAPGLLPRIVDGEPRLALLDPGAVFLNPAARAALGLDAAAAPRRLTLLAGSRASELRIAGDIGAPGPPLAVIDIAGAQAEFGLVGRLSRIDVRLAPGADRAAVLRDFALPAGVRAAAPDEAAQRLSNVSRAYRVNLTVLALVALFTGAFLVFSVLALSVAQRQPQFALLGVLGMPARERLRLVLAESALLGLVGSGLGLALGTALAALALRWLAGDLGGGFFAPGAAPPLQFSGAAALTYGALGVAAAMAGGWLPAREAQRLAPAQALKGLAAADDGGPRHPWLGPALLLAGVLLALCPPLFGLPLAAYVAVGCVLLGGIASVPAMVALLLRGVATPSRSALALLAVERARRERHAATIAVAGVVASLALSVALTVMVASFRESMTRWLDTVLPADLYVRGAASLAAGDSVFLAPELVQAVARLPGVRRVAAQRSTQVQLAADRPAVALLA